MLFVSGTRDSLADAAALRSHAEEIPGPVSFHWIESADHGFKPLKSSGLTTDNGVRAGGRRTVTSWVTGLPG